MLDVKSVVFWNERVFSLHNTKKAALFPHYRGFTITFRHTTPGRTPPDEWAARRRDLYMTTHNTHIGQSSMPPAGFESPFPAKSGRVPTS